jgi:hypothetical protein
MKAREENGFITLYPELPADWRTYLNFRMAPASVIASEGFYDVEEPSFDPVTHNLGSLIFDAGRKVFTYEIIAKVLPTLEQAKSLKLEELKKAVKPLYNTVQWLVTMYNTEGEALPTALKEKIRLIKTRYDQAKTQINSLTTVVDVLRWQVPYDAINSLRTELENYG